MGFFQTKIEGRDVAPAEEQKETGPSKKGLSTNPVAHPFDQMSPEEQVELARSIVLLIPHRRGEGINVGICGNFGRWAMMGLQYGYVTDPFGGFIEMTRSALLRMFLEHSATHTQSKYLVMIDNDEGVEWDAPLRLAAWGKALVSGVVCGYSPERGIFSCFTIKDENGIARFPSMRETKVMPSEGLVEAHQVGTGLLCIRRDVVETMCDKGEPFFLPEDIRLESVRAGSVRKSEDIVFSERCAEQGFGRYVDLSVHAYHEKTIPLSWPREAISADLSAEDWKSSIYDYRGEG